MSEPSYLNRAHAMRLYEAVCGSAVLWLCTTFNAVWYDVFATVRDMTRLGPKLGHKWTHPSATGRDAGPHCPSRRSGQFLHAYSQNVCIVFTHCIIEPLKAVLTDIPVEIATANCNARHHPHMLFHGGLSKTLIGLIRQWHKMIHFWNMCTTCCALHSIPCPSSSPTSLAAWQL